MPEGWAPGGRVSEGRVREGLVPGGRVSGDLVPGGRVSGGRVFRGVPPPGVWFAGVPGAIWLAGICPGSVSGGDLPGGNVVDSLGGMAAAHPDPLRVTTEPARSAVQERGGVLGRWAPRPGWLSQLLGLGYRSLFRRLGRGGQRAGAGQE